MYLLYVYFTHNINLVLSLQYIKQVTISSMYKLHHYLDMRTTNIIFPKKISFCINEQIGLYVYYFEIHYCTLHKKCVGWTENLKVQQQVIQKCEKIANIVMWMRS